LQSFFFFFVNMSVVWVLNLKVWYGIIHNHKNVFYFTFCKAFVVLPNLPISLLSVCQCLSMQLYELTYTCVQIHLILILYFVHALVLLLINFTHLLFILYSCLHVLVYLEPSSGRYITEYRAYTKEWCGFNTLIYWYRTILLCMPVYNCTIILKIASYMIIYIHSITTIKIQLSSTLIR
jgi:hypothetical protein